MARKVWLIHWKPEEAKARVATLEGAGYQVDLRNPAGGQGLKDLRSDPPAALVIDLSRLASHGKAIGLAVRGTKLTRHIPLVFVGGEAEKVEKIRSLLPDAVYAEWRGIRGGLKRAIEHPPANPVAGPGPMQISSSTPLWKKLGIKPGIRVGLIDAPAELERALEGMPDGVELVEGEDRRAGLFLWFVHDADAFRRGLRRMVGLSRQAPLWICYQKQAAGGTLPQQEVRESAIATGLVDYKVCAIDSTWTGLLFRPKRV